MKDLYLYNTTHPLAESGKPIFIPFREWRYDDARRQRLDRAHGERIANELNAELTMLYWNVGHRINKEILGEKRAEYGKRVVAELSGKLMAEHGAIWNEKHLRALHYFSKPVIIDY